MASGSTRVVVIAFIMNLFITLSKFVAWFFTGSASMLAESFHSVADTGNQVFLYLGIQKAQKPPDAQHPYGYGNEEYFYSFLVAILIFSVGAIFAVYEGIHKTLHPGHLENGIWNVAVLGFAVLLETYSAFVATKEINKVRGKMPILRYARQSKDQVLITVLFEDYAALMGLGIAFIGNLGTLLTGNPLYDSIGSIVIGVLLGLIAFFLFTETKSLLIGEGATEKDRHIIREIFESAPEMVDVKEILTLHFGANQILINAHVKLKSGMTIEEVEVAIDRIEARIVAQVPNVFKIFIETHQKDKLETIERKAHV